MSTPSLGRMLKALACTTPECLQKLERQAADKGQCAERDLQTLRDFFHHVSVEAAASIIAGLAPLPVVLGNGQHDKIAALLQTYRWKEGYDLRDPTHPYNGVWRPFQAWCDASELQVHIACQRDGAGKEKWYTLSMLPAEHLAMAAPYGSPPIG